MTVYASGQQVASNPATLQAGVPTQVLLEGYSFGAQAVTDLACGSACFFVDQNGVDTTVQQTSAGASTNPFAGIVLRSNANSMPFSASLQGFSNSIPTGQSASVLTRTSVAVPIAAANEGASPVVGSAVWAILASGLLQTQAVGGSAVAGGVLTNFRVKRVPSGWSAGGLVEITNVQNVGA